MSIAGIGRLQLHYESAGAASGSCSCTARCRRAGLLAGYQQRLAGYRRVITVELQGHGHTRDIGRPLRYELLADDMRRCWASSAWVRPTSPGAAGAGVALQLALRRDTGQGLRPAGLPVRDVPRRWPPSRDDRWRGPGRGGLPTEIAAIPAPVLLVAADNDVVRLEHTVELYHLLGGGINGDVRCCPRRGLRSCPARPRRAVRDRAGWVVPMITEFLGD